MLNGFLNKSRVVLLSVFLLTVVLCACGGGSHSQSETEKMLINAFSSVLPEAEVRAENVGDYWQVTIKTGKLDSGEIPAEEKLVSIEENLLWAYDDITEEITVCAQIVDSADTVLFNSRNGELKWNYFADATTNRPTISLDEYKKIYIGMKYDEVVSVIGGTGKTLSSVDIGDRAYATEVVMWEGDGLIGANATITFQGGRVYALAQVGLQ